MKKENLKSLICNMVDAEDVAEILMEFIMEHYVNDETAFDYGVFGMDEDDVRDVLIEHIVYSDPN